MGDYKDWDHGTTKFTNLMAKIDIDRGLDFPI